MARLHLFWALNIMPLSLPLSLPLFRFKKQQGKEQAKSTIRDYILALYAVMEKEGTCFLRGSFVIDDLNGRFKQLLAAAKTNSLVPIPKSHTGFNPVRTTICKDGVCEVHTEIIIKCGEEGIKKENIKWYVFNNTGSASAPVDRYVFLKLEGEATISFGHAFRAFQRYVLKKQAKTGVSTQTRRQDCQKDEKGCHCPRQGCKQDKQTVKIGDVCIPKRQQYGRIGDEYFVTSELNDALIDRVSTIKGSVQTIINDIGPCQQQGQRQKRLQQPVQAPRTQPIIQGPRTQQVRQSGTQQQPQTSQTQQVQQRKQPAKQQQTPQTQQTRPQQPARQPQTQQVQKRQQRAQQPQKPQQAPNL